MEGKGVRVGHHELSGQVAGGAVLPGTRSTLGGARSFPERDAPPGVGCKAGLGPDVVRSWVVATSAVLLAVSLGACRPRVELAAPEKPITINMNLKIDHEVRVKIERELDEVIGKESDLF